MEESVPIPGGNLGPMAAAIEIANALGDEKSLRASGNLVLKKCMAFESVFEAEIANGKPFCLQTVITRVKHAGGFCDTPKDEGAILDPIDFELAREIFSEGFFLSAERDFFNSVTLVKAEGRKIGCLACAFGMCR